MSLEAFKVSTKYIGGIDDANVPESEAVSETPGTVISKVPGGAILRRHRLLSQTQSRCQGLRV